MAVPSGGILAAESISKALGDLMKGMFGVEQATPDIQGKIAQMGHQQRQEALQLAQLPQQQQMHTAQLQNILSQIEARPAQIEQHLAAADASRANALLHRGQAADLPHQAKLRDAQTEERIATAKWRNAEAAKAQRPPIRTLNQAIAEIRLKPAEERSLEERILVAEFDANEKLKATEIRSKNLQATSHAEYYQALTRKLEKELKTGKSDPVTARMEHNLAIKIGQQAATQADESFRTVVGKDFSSISSDPKIVDEVRMYLMNERRNEMLKMNKLDAYTTPTKPLSKEAKAAWDKARVGAGKNSGWKEFFSGMNPFAKSETGPKVTQPDSTVTGDEWGEVTVKP